MKLSIIERYEIKAQAFQSMTGHMAPGKDAPSALYPASYEERKKVRDEWLKQHGECVRAMLRGFEAIMGDGE